MKAFVPAASVIGLVLFLVPGCSERLPPGSQEAGTTTAVVTKDEPAKPAEMPQAPAPSSGAKADLGPKVTIRIDWNFTQGSDGTVVPNPNRWQPTVTLRNADSHAWMVEPDLVIGEACGADAIAGAVCLSTRQGKRDAALPFVVGTAPADDSGKTRRSIYWSGGGQYHVSTMDTIASWRLNGKKLRWEATAIKPNDELVCSWEHLGLKTFKQEVKHKPDFIYFHLGPVVYDSDSAKGVAYVVTGQYRNPFGDKSQRKEDMRILPLTAAAIQREVADETKPTFWRAQFVFWLWDQARPVADADKLVAEIARNAKLPSEVRVTALNRLAAMPEAGKSVLEELKEDNEVGKAARELLKEKADRSPATPPKKSDAHPAASKTDTEQKWLVTDGTFQILNEGYTERYGNATFTIQPERDSQLVLIQCNVKPLTPDEKAVERLAEKRKQIQASISDTGLVGRVVKDRVPLSAADRKALTLKYRLFTMEHLVLTDGTGNTGTPFWCVSPTPKLSLYGPLDALQGESEQSSENENNGEPRGWGGTVKALRVFAGVLEVGKTARVSLIYSLRKEVKLQELKLCLDGGQAIPLTKPNKKSVLSSLRNVFGRPTP